MDHEKYYLLRRDGSYSVHFPNSKGLPMDEINRLFSEYGEVLSVKFFGHDNGLCYVRYRTLDDIIKCINGFRNHPLIRILREKTKVDSTNSNEESNTQRSWGRSEESNEQTKQRNEYKSVNKKFGKVQRGDKEALNYDGCSDISSTSKGSSRYNNTHNKRQKNNSQIGKLMENSSTPNLVQSKNGNRDMELSPPLSCPDESNITSNICDEEEIPALVSTTDIKQHHLNSNRSKVPSSRVTAAEVIVANVHPNFGIHYILHLFEKYEPIFVTLMKVIPSTELRYCHVYFKSGQNAMEVEKEFDNYILSGNSLIVLRAQKCIEESTLA